MNTQLKNAINLFRFFHIDLQENIDFSGLEFEDIKTSIQMIKDDYSEHAGAFNECMQSKDSNYMRSIDILETCLESTNSDFNDLEFYEFFDLLDTVLEAYIDSTADFWLEDLPCGECRLIHEDDIEDLWHDGLIEQIKECYDLSEVPDFVEIDWDQTANNCKVDGLGHHFAGYDHQEHFCNGFYIFRIN